MSLDHLILLSAPSTLNETEAYLSPWFSVVEGGTHKGGATANSLITLPSGTYIELIHFLISGTSHPWANLPAGHIDYALLGKPSQAQRDTFQKVQDERGEGEGWIYDEGVVGGRKRLDGVQVDWVVTGPGKAQGRGGIPFFCGDTPSEARDLRVPAIPSPHPSKAISVSHITLLATSERYQSLKAYLTALQGSTLSSTETSTTFPLYSPNALPPGTPEAEIHLRVAESEDETAYLTKRGPHALYELGFYTESDGGKEGLEVEDGSGSRFVFQRV